MVAQVLRMSCSCAAAAGAGAHTDRTLWKRSWNLVFVLHLQWGFFVREREWRAAAIHQGTIVGEVSRQQVLEAGGDDLSVFRTSRTPRNWVTSWAEKQ